MRIVISGATSMIGTALINECIAGGDTVLAIVRRDSKRLSRLPKPEGLQLEYADLDSFAQVKGDGTPYDVFYHFAWAHTNRLERDDPRWQETNIRATLDAAELALRLGCKTFIGAGSQAEYGSLDVEIDEQTRSDPQVAYGMAKMSACLLSRKFCEQHGIKHIWTRIFSVYGTNDSDGVMIDYAVKRFLKNEPAQFSAATNIWNYLFEKDAGIIFRLLGLKDVEPGIYCVASDDCRELKSYIMEMKDAANTASEITFASENGSTKAINLNVKTDKLRKAIGYTPQIRFSEGIRMVINSTIQAMRLETEKEELKIDTGLFPKVAFRAGIEEMTEKIQTTSPALGGKINNFLCNLLSFSTCKGGLILHAKGGLLYVKPNSAKRYGGHLFWSC